MGVAKPGSTHADDLACFGVLYVLDERQGASLSEVRVHKKCLLASVVRGEHPQGIHGIPLLNRCFFTGFFVFVDDADKAGFAGGHGGTAASEVGGTVMVCGKYRLHT